MIGDELTIDIMFANLNKMASVWVYRNRKEYEGMWNDFEELYSFDTFKEEHYHRNPFK